MFNDETNGGAGGSEPSKRRRRDELTELFATMTTREQIIAVALEGADYADQLDDLIASTRRLVVSVIRDQFRLSRHRWGLYELIDKTARLSERAATLPKQGERALALMTLRKALTTEAAQAPEVERLDQERKIIVERLMADNEWVPRDILAEPLGASE